MKTQIKHLEGTSDLWGFLSSTLHAVQFAVYGISALKHTAIPLSPYTSHVTFSNMGSCNRSPITTATLTCL